METTTQARIDHVVVYGGPHLEALAVTYRRLGFTLTPQGHHTLGSSNHLAIFGTDYLELLGVLPQDVERFGDGWNHPPGLSGLVFKTDDAQALWQRLEKQGVPLAGVKPDVFSRPVELEDGTRRDARFRVVRIALDQFPNGRVYFCEQQTPELVWRPAWQQHANQVISVARYCYAAAPDALQHMAQLLQRSSGATSAEPVAQGWRLRLGNAAVDVRSREAIAMDWAVAQTLVPDKEGAVALALRTRSLDAVRRALRAGNVIAVRDEARRIVVAPEDAGGVLLAFVV